MGIGNERNPLRQREKEVEPVYGEVVIERGSDGNYHTEVLIANHGVNLKPLVIVGEKGSELLFLYDQRDPNSSAAGLTQYRLAHDSLTKEGEISGLISPASSKSLRTAHNFAQETGVPLLVANKYPHGEPYPYGAVPYSPITAGGVYHHLHIPKSDVLRLGSLQRRGRLIGLDDVYSTGQTLKAIRRLQVNNGLKPFSDAIVAAREVPAQLTDQPYILNSGMSLSYSLNGDGSPDFTVHAGATIPLIDLGQHAASIEQFLGR